MFKKRKKVVEEKMNFATRGLKVSLYKRMKILAAFRDWSIQDVLNAALEEGLPHLELETLTNTTEEERKGEVHNG